MENPTTNLVIYHADCLDGLTSAAVAVAGLGGMSTLCAPMEYKKKDEEYIQAIADIISCSNIVPGNVTLYAVDFSFPPAVAKQLSEYFYQIVILDHHDSAIRKWEKVEPIDNIKAIFNTERSGAGLAWDYFEDGIAKCYGENSGAYENIKTIAMHVEDRDLWRFKYDQTKAIAAFLFIHIDKTPFDFLNLIVVAGHLNIMTAGDAIVKYQDSLFNSMQQDLHGRKFESRRGNGTCFIVPNIPHMLRSDFCSFVLERYPDVDFIVVPYLYLNMGHGDLPEGAAAEQIKVSFRSRKGGKNVNALAEKLGGGGHLEAASCYVDDINEVFNIL